jgi:hypothetical protein
VIGRTIVNTSKGGTMRGAFIVGTLILVGCGSDTNVDIDSNANNVCSEIAEVACHNLFQCCTEGEIENFLNVSDPRTELQCRADVARSCERSIATFDDSIKQNRVRFDPQVMNTCLNALVAPADTCAEVVTELPWTQACMDSAWVGTVTDGQACLFAHDCAGGPGNSFCAPNQKCTALPGSGQPCSSMGCAENLFCSGTTCQPQLGQNSPCTSQQQCQTPLFCDFNQPTPICTERGAGGDPCTGSGSCLSGQCIPGTCAGTNNSCFTDTQCNGHCADDNSFCTQPSDCGIGMCSMSAVTCTSNTQCISPPVGNTCVFPVQCLPGDCVGDPVCTAQTIIVDYCTGALGQLPIP